MRMLKLAALASAVAMASPAFAVDFLYNPTPGTDITIPGTGTSGPATPFPVTFTVAGLGTVLDVNLTILGLTHSYAEDLRIWLESPTGTIVELLDNAGGDDAFRNNDITFDQDVANTIPNSSLSVANGVSYSFKPSSYSPPDGSSLDDFNGESANGVWKLFVYDDNTRDTGYAAGAKLSITTTAGAVPEPATWGMLLAGFAVVGSAMRRRARRTSVSFV